MSHLSTIFNDFPFPEPPDHRDHVEEVGTDRQVWQACQALGLDEEVTAIVMDRHRSRPDDCLLTAALEFAATPCWGRGMSEREVAASGIPARHTALAMQDYVRALIFVALNGRLPFQPE